MASLAQLRIDVPRSATAASEGLVAILREAGYELDDQSLPGAAELLFTKKRSVLYVKRQGGAQITGQGEAATIELGLDVAPGQPAGLLDGKHNRSLVEDLRERIVAALGSA